MKTTSSLRLGVVALALVAGAALPSRTASAQPQPPGNTAVAEALFQQARDLVKQSRYAEACPKLAESQRLEPKLGTLLNLAVCHERLGKIATAWAEYTSAAVIAGRDGAKERADFARDQVAALEKRLARVTFRVKAPPAGFNLTLDDQLLDGAALNTSLPIDPGKHRLTATAPGMTAWSSVLDVPSERAELEVPIPTLTAAAPTPPPVAPPVATSLPVAPPPVVVAPPQTTPPGSGEALPPRNDARVLMIAGFGVGGAGVLVGAITGIVTLTKAGTIRDTCTNNHCDASQDEPIRSATTLANVSNASLIIGAVGAGVGVAGLLWSRSSAPKTAFTVTPTLGPAALGLRGTF